MKKLALPVEDAALLEEKLRSWVEHYEPSTPGECELIEMAVTASVQRTRSRRYLTAALSEQVLGAEKRWDEAREDEVLVLVKLLDREPGAAVARLRAGVAGSARSSSFLLSPRPSSPCAVNPAFVSPGRPVTALRPRGHGADCVETAARGGDDRAAWSSPL